MTEALAYWFVATLIGAAAFPLAFAFFSRLPDRGYAFARVVGLLLVGYGLWIGATVGLFPNSRGSVILLIVLLAVASLAAVRGHRRELADYFRTGWRYLLFVELFFAGAFAAAVTLRSFVPEIQGGEKPFELAFLNALARNDTFPPEDPWLAGSPISYYYFGYLIMGGLTNLTGLGGNVTFFLSLSLVAALAATAIFGVVYNLIVASRPAGPAVRGPALPPRAVVFALAAAALLLVVSNLEGVFELMARHGIGSQGFYGKLGVFGLEGPYDCDASPGDCREWYPTRFLWWWWATRMGSIWDIQEFPFFSFHFGDLHPHVIGLPFVITAVAIALQFFRSEERLDGGWPRRHPWAFLFAAAFLGGLGFLNLWDLPTFYLLVVAAVFAANWLRQGRAGLSTVRDTLGFALPLGVLAALMYIPFYVTFDTGTSGLEPVEAAVRPDYAPLNSTVTRPLHLLLFWTPLLWVGLPFAASRLLRRGDRPMDSAQTLAAVLPWLAPVVIWTAWVVLRRGLGGFTEELDTRGGNVLTVLMLAGAVGIASTAFARELFRDHGLEGARRSHAFALLALGGGTLLILGPELFFIDDVNGFRPNTVFKLWFQAWMLLSIGGAFGMYHLTRGWRLPELAPGRLRWETVRAAAFTVGGLYTLAAVLPPLGFLRSEWWTPFLGAALVAVVAAANLASGAVSRARPGLTAARLSWAGVSVVIIGGALVYTVTATMERTGGFENDSSMDGYVNILRNHPDEYEAVRWLNDNVAGLPVLAEAVDGSYTDGARISSRTGLPTVLGWPGHERLWRGSDGPLAGREEDVRRLYESEDPAEARQLLNKYGVEYVYVGWLERQQYDPDNTSPGRFQKFAEFMDVVFQNDEVTIYRMAEPQTALAREAP
jgi:YYY domain-containing protein